MATKVCEVELLQTDLSGFAIYPSGQKSTCTHKVSHIKYLRSLNRWDDFEEAFNFEVKHLSNEKKYLPFDLPENLLADQIIETEIDVGTLLQKVLVYVFQKQILKDKGRFRLNFPMNVGIADLVYILNDDLNSNLFERVRLIVEIKTKWVMHDPPDNLVNYYKTKLNFRDVTDSIVSSMIQLYTYMLRNKRKYGVLTSFDASYFFKLEDDRDLIISNKITPKNLLKAFKYILDMSIADGVLNISASTATDKSIPKLEYDISSEDDSPVTEKDKDDKKRKKDELSEDKASKKKALENVNDSEIDDVLESGTILLVNDLHTVKKVRLRNQYVKLKICDVVKRDSSELENEANIYKYLNSNNIRMGEFVFSGLISDMFYTLCVKFIDGETVEFKKMTPKVRENCINALEQLHSVGIEHGDLRQENFIVDSNENVIIVDFENSRITERKSFLNYEMNRLKSLLFDQVDS